MAESDSPSSLPKTPEEADAYEKPIRRQMYIGFAIGLAVIMVIIVIIMEARYRTTLGQPQPSEYLDDSMQEVVDAAAPLPDALGTVQVGTNRGAEHPVYEVFLRDGEGRILYHMARRADTVYALEAGRRVGGAMSFEVILTLNANDKVNGRYRPDRGIPIGHYQAVLQKLLWDGLAGYKADSVYPLELEPVDGLVDTPVVHRQWNDVMD